MEAIKTSKKVEFDVIYSDGTRRRVHEGVLFEVEDDQMIFHNGTRRAQVWFAAAESALFLIEGMGLLRIFSEYIRSDPEDRDTLRIVTKLSGARQRIASAEQQAVFRLGQKDMQESVMLMLRDAVAQLPSDSVVGAALMAAADLVKDLEVE